MVNEAKPEGNKTDGSLGSAVLKKLGFKNQKDKSMYLKLAGILIVGVILMNLAGSFSQTKEQQTSLQTQAGEQNQYLGSEEALEAKLEQILSQVKGAGTVDVAITYAQSGSVQYATNTETSHATSSEFQDTGTDGSTPVLSQSEQSSENISIAVENDAPIIVSQSMPKPQGVLIVAQGANDQSVKKVLFDAASALLDLPAYRIVVVTGKYSE